ncbi:TPA: hypothetical protein TUL06_001239 [Streptococcus equi subsp. zooepidemicus]|uniref:Phage protein n=1 Tax=Streptococcus equi subsp. zooepidemicus Sz4is TaxID=1381082 RepID=A0AAW3GPA9_STRSZ|nr:hypothetical protein AT55_01056 [Streptococcus equi subsp. zooepidemicus Sz4is]HEL0009503.1 hypothetical protein [Streptococcus equi subsp. zooepidemicus]HEL0011577.1 hypothetical protein [Streptococcus equi subsp. zooepidemicus]HEL0014100.1 hypothetical protein [Streptococcus equi subsp. zooepidemicus]HEL0018134.1 hypothetical protein [Streptococcus equi subsp. zooepidemicus]
MEQKYYAVLIQINIGKSVWLVPQKNGTLAWSDEISGTRVFSSYEEAKRRTESDFLESFGFIGSYKIIEFTHQELLDFEIIVEGS